MYATGSSRIGLAFRTRPTAPTHAYTQTGAATKSQNDPIRAERLRGRAWRDATSCTASSGVYSRASEISRAEHGALKSTDLSWPEPEYPSVVTKGRTARDGALYSLAP